MMTPEAFAGPATPLAAEDLRAAAQRLGVNLAAVQAVETVESCKRGFDPDTGRPIILFEPYVFARATGHRFDASHPHVSFAERWAEPYPQGQRERYAQLFEAMRLDAEAALASASWGLFQVMGGNFKRCGFDGVEPFVRAMVGGEAAHLDAFVSFVLADPAMLKALQLKDWSGFARRYNGPAYAQHAYDQKLKAAYAAAQARSGPARVGSAEGATTPGPEK